MRAESFTREAMVVSVAQSSTSYSHLRMEEGFDITLVRYMPEISLHTGYY